MYQDTRNQLKTVDISCYSKELATFQEKLKFRELATSTVKNYLSNLKIMHSNWNPWHGCIKCSEGWS